MSLVLARHAKMTILSTELPETAFASTTDVPRLKFRLLGTFGLAVGDGGYQPRPKTLQTAILGYMAFHGPASKRDSIKANCWVINNPRDERTGGAYNKQLLFLQNDLTELVKSNGFSSSDYILDEGSTFCFKEGVYETDLQSFLKFYDAGEKAQGKKRRSLMEEALRHYRGDLLENVKGGWIRAERDKIKIKAEKAREYVQELAEEGGLPNDDLPLPISDVNDAPRPEATPKPTEEPESTWSDRAKRGIPRVLFLLCVAAVCSILIIIISRNVIPRPRQSVAVSATSNDAAGAAEPYAFATQAWRPASDPPPPWVTPQAGVSDVRCFRLKQAINVPAGVSRVHVAVSCASQARIVYAEPEYPVGSIEDKTTYDTRKEWEWLGGQDAVPQARRMNVQVVVWIGVTAHHGIATPPEAVYWFVPPM